MLTCKIFRIIPNMSSSHLTGVSPPSGWWRGNSARSGFAETNHQLLTPSVTGGVWVIVETGNTPAFVVRSEHNKDPVVW